MKKSERRLVEREPFKRERERERIVYAHTFIKSNNISIVELESFLFCDKYVANTCAGGKITHSFPKFWFFEKEQHERKNKGPHILNIAGEEKEKRKKRETHQQREVKSSNLLHIHKYGFYLLFRDY